MGMAAEITAAARKEPSVFGRKKRKREMKAEVERAVEEALWGAPEAPGPKEPEAVVRMTERIDSMDDASRRRRYAALCAGIAAFAALCVGAAAFTTCSFSPDDEGPENPLASDASEERQGPQEEDPLVRYVNLDAFAFLSDESKLAFGEQMAAYLSGLGVPENEFVMCYSRIDEPEEGRYSGYASCPNGEVFYRIDFSVDTGEFAFEQLEGTPDGLPEINYGLELSEAEAEGRYPVYSGQDGPSEEDTEDAAYRGQTPPAEEAGAPAQQPAEAAVSDAAALARILPERAAELLPEALGRYCAMKGLSCDASAFSVPEDSVGARGGLVVFHLDGPAAIDCEWDPGAEAFGMALL